MEIVITILLLIIFILSIGNMLLLAGLIKIILSYSQKNVNIARMEAADSGLIDITNSQTKLT